MTVQFSAPVSIDKGSLPDFATPVDALRVALPILAPPARVTVSAAAAKYRRLDTLAYRGPWRNDVAPYMVEPMDKLTSRRFNALVFVGPARSAKTDALIINPIVHGVTSHPRNMTIVHMSKDSARDFSLEKIDGMIRSTAPVRDKLMTSAGADNIFDKRFIGGMRLSIAWPVVSKLSARDIPFVALSDYDRMDDDIGGEGDPFSLGRKRTQTFGTLGMTVVESSPGRPILDEGWRRKTPHEAPPCTGILGLYNRGTRARFYWQCPGCDEDFEPTFATLVWPEKVVPAIAGAETSMVCPHCGSIIEPDDKTDLNAGGKWLHEAADGSLVSVDDECIRPTDVLSYWLPGPPATFQKMGEIVQRYLEAKAHFDATGDEAPLKATTNVDQGNPHLPRARSVGGNLIEETLKERAERYPLGIAPDKTRFITVAVDVQANRFVCHVDAWGAGLERWLIQRFELFKPPADAPRAGERAIDPALYAEDWDVLFGLLDRAFPVAGTGKALTPIAVAIDSHGGPGVTERAYGFWRRAKRKRLGKRFKLISGEGGFKKRRAFEGYPEGGIQRKKGARPDVPLVRVSTDRLKDEVAASLTREEPGPGAYHLPSDIDPRVFGEMAAERRTDKGWERKAGNKANEALDLAVYGKALVIVLGAEKFNWDVPKNWACPIENNVLAVDLDEVEDGIVPGEVAKSAPRRRFARLRKGRKL